MALRDLPFRSQVEHRSAPIIEWLLTRPRWVAPGAIAVLFLAAIVLPTTVAWIPTTLVALFIGWLLYLTWPRLTRPEKLLRIAVLFLVLALTVTRALPR